MACCRPAEEDVCKTLLNFDSAKVFYRLLPCFGRSLFAWIVGAVTYKEVNGLPSEKVLTQKQQQVEELSELLKSAVAGVVVDYKGINVEDDTKLRRELRGADVRYMVVKNSLLRRAVEKAGFEGLQDVLTGTTALAVCNTDAVAAAKILNKYAEESKGKFSIKAGFVEGNLIDEAGVASLAKLPSREELVAMTLRGLNAPIAGLANVLNGTIRGLVIALNQIAQKSA